MEQMAKYYWGMLTAAAGSSSPRSYWPPPAHAAAGEPSWEELAFARDAAAGHLGGCVWPPRSYTCTFCRREFRSAQALGGHMNVHRRDRARLRQCASPDHDDDDAHKQQKPSIGHHQQLLQLQESDPSLLFRAKAAAAPIISAARPKSTSTCCDRQIYDSHDDPQESPLPSIVKESKNKLVISIPAAATTIDDDDEVAAAERRKRRRLHQQPAAEALLPLFFQLRPLASSKSAGVEHDGAKVPKRITSPSSPNTLLHLAARPEVDLELRLALTK